MQAEIPNVVDVMNTVNTTALEAAKAIAEINKRTVDQITQQQLALVGQALEGGVRQLKLLQEAKGYPEYFAAQAELAKEGTEKVLAAANETLGALATARDELSSLVEQGVKDTAAQVKHAAAPVKAAPAKKTA